MQDDKSQSKAGELNVSEKLVDVLETSPVLPDQLTMDSTSHVEISVMLNQKFSDEIVKRAHQALNLNKLDKLKAKKFPMFLEEGKRQINELWTYSEEANIDDHQWIEEHKSKISDSELRKVYQFISRLFQILEIDLNQNQIPAEVAGEGSTK